jgi:hypothetical protein
MPRVPLLFLQVLSLAGAALTLAKIFKIRLHRKYRFFSLFFLYRMLAFAGSLFLDVRSDSYFFFWIFSQPVSWVLSVLVIWELTGLILDKYPGIKKLGQWFMYASMGVSLAVSILSMLPKINPTIAARSKVMGYMFAVDRGLVLSVVVFLVVMLALLSRYPVRLPRNVVIHSYLYTIFFLSISLSLLARTILGVRIYEAGDKILMAISSACGFAWFWLLSEKGEQVSTPAAPIDRNKEEHLLLQLDHLNQTLVKARKS